MFGEEMKYYVWGVVEACTGINDIYFGQLTGKAIGDYDVHLNVMGIWWGVSRSSANSAQQQNQRQFSLV